MSQLNLFAIVGDSNIRRHLLSSTNTQDRPRLANAQFIPCSRLSALASSLETVKPEVEACVLACVSNFVTATAPASSVSLRCESIFKGFIEKAGHLAQGRPGLQVFLCPPMYRSTPLWYRDGLPEMLQKFSSCFKVS